MSLTIIGILSVITIFSLFNIYILHLYYIPHNLSITRYWLETRHTALGLLHSIVFTIIDIIITPIWVKTNINYFASSSTYVWLCLFSSLCILIVCCTPHYYKTINLRVIHYLSAFFAAFSTFMWILMVAIEYIYIPLLILSISTYIAIATRTLRSCLGYWLELISFYSIFITLLIINIQIK